MSKTVFFKVSAEKRQDQLIKLSNTNYLLIFAFGEEDGQGYNWRKYYDHEPTAAEVKADTEALINSIVDENIIKSFKWNNIPVYLSQENQLNFKAAYDLAVQTDGKTLPVRFKLGEDADGNPMYHTFTELSDFADFYTKAVAHVIAALNEGWKEKDGINYQNLKG